MGYALIRSSGSYVTDYKTDYSDSVQSSYKETFSGMTKRRDFQRLLQTTKIDQPLILGSKFDICNLSQHLLHSAIATRCDGNTFFSGNRLLVNGAIPLWHPGSERDSGNAP